MSVEKIIEKIKLEAKDQAETIMNTARMEQERYLKEARTAAEAEMAVLISSGKRDVDSEVSRILAQARMEARQTRRSMRERLISQCFDQATEKIDSVLESQVYQEILSYLAKEAIEKIGEKNIIFSANSRDIPLLREIIASEIHDGVSIEVSGTPIQARGGVLLQTVAGGRCVNNTIDARLDRMKRDLIFDVAGILATKEGED